MRTHKKPLVQPSQIVAGNIASAGSNTRLTHITECADRDRLHWTRARLTAILDHLASETHQFLHLKQGESACVEGQPAEALFLVRGGLLKLSLVSFEGSQSVSEIVGFGDCFGEECAGEGQAHCAETATALVPTALFKISRRNLVKKLEEPAFAKLYVSAVIHRVHEYEDLLAQHAFENSEQRLASALGRLSKFGRWENGTMVRLPQLTHETLSEIVGTTRPRITSFMRSFLERGIVLSSSSGLTVNIERLSDVLLQGGRLDRANQVKSGVMHRSMHSRVQF